MIVENQILEQEAYEVEEIVSSNPTNFSRGSVKN